MAQLPLTIAMIGVADLDDKVDYLYDPMLFHAMMLMSLNLAEATYQTDKLGFDYTPPLKFAFTERPLIFCKHPTRPDIPTLIRDHLLLASDGIIINLSHSIGRRTDPLVLLLKEIIQIVSMLGRPTVFATSSANIEGGWPPKDGEVVVQPLTSIVQSVTESFPITVPILGYSYMKPSSIQDVLITLLAEIDKANLAKEESQT